MLEIHKLYILLYCPSVLVYIWDDKTLFFLYQPNTDDQKFFSYLMDDYNDIIYRYICMISYIIWNLSWEERCPFFINLEMSGYTPHLTPPITPIINVLNNILTIFNLFLRPLKTPINHSSKQPQRLTIICYILRTIFRTSR